jgi:hypothetical protein
LKMAMHALAEGYLIKGDYGQVTTGEQVTGDVFRET